MRNYPSTVGFQWHHANSETIIRIYCLECRLVNALFQVHNTIIAISQQQQKRWKEKNQTFSLADHNNKTRSRKRIKSQKRGYLWAFCVSKPAAVKFFFLKKRSTFYKRETTRDRAELNENWRWNDNVRASAHALKAKRQQEHLLEI